MEEQKQSFSFIGIRVVVINLGHRGKGRGKRGHGRALWNRSEVATASRVIGGVTDDETMPSADRATLHVWSSHDVASSSDI